MNWLFKATNVDVIEQFIMTTYTDETVKLAQMKNELLGIPITDALIQAYKEILCKYYIRKQIPIL